MLQSPQENQIDIPRAITREWQILGHDEKAVPGSQSVKTGTRKTTGNEREIVAVVKETAASMQ